MAYQNCQRLFLPRVRYLTVSCATNRTPTFGPLMCVVLMELTYQLSQSSTCTEADWSSVGDSGWQISFGFSCSATQRIVIRSPTNKFNPADSHAKSRPIRYYLSVWQAYAANPAPPGNQNPSDMSSWDCPASADGVLNPPRAINPRRNPVRFFGRQGLSFADQHGHARAGGDHRERRIAVGHVKSCDIPSKSHTLNLFWRRNF